jgi:hypothetical protein
MSPSISECLENARQCEWYAARTGYEKDREFLLRKAKIWRKVAIRKELEIRTPAKTAAADDRPTVLDSAKATFRWSGDEAEVRRLEDEHTHHYLRWTFLSIVAVMIVGVIGVGLSFLD